MLHLPHLLLTPGMSNSQASCQTLEPFWQHQNSCFYCVLEEIIFEDMPPWNFSEGVYISVKSVAAGVVQLVIDHVPHDIRSAQLLHEGRLTIRLICCTKFREQHQLNNRNPGAQCCLASCCPTVNAHSPAAADQSSLCLGLCLC